MASELSFIPWRAGDRKYVPLVISLWVVLAVLVTVFFVVFTVLRVDGPSMTPFLQDEDRVLITRGYPTPERGDIVAIEIPAEFGGGRIIKRVIAIPGDEIEVIGDTAFVNGEVSLVTPDPIIGPDTRRLGAATVPEGSVFVMGDNRPVSLDSRSIGFVPLAAVTGEVVAVILPLPSARLVD